MDKFPQRLSTDLVHPSLLEKRIIHVDMDAFYASIEVRDDPSLKGKPIAVGGSKKGRGVIATCNYEARRYGVRSAMATAYALKLCPYLILKPARFEAYREASKTIRKVFGEFTDSIEPLSLDEAFLDVTHHKVMTATQVALAIKERIFEETKLTASAGVAPNKMIAKIASDLRKPNGISIVIPHQVFSFMQNLEVRKIPGIGPKSADRLAERGIYICSDVLSQTEAQIKQWFGNRFGSWLYQRAQGIDERFVESGRGRKSLGAERTFASDLLDVKQIQEKLTGIVDELINRMNKSQVLGKTVTLKVKYRDVQQVTRSITLPHHTNRKGEVFEALFSLFAKTEIGTRPIRLLGASFSNVINESDALPYHQPSLF